MTAGLEPVVGLFVGGHHEEASLERDLIDPASGRASIRVGLGVPADLDRAVQAARRALDGPWGDSSPSERSALLHALADALHGDLRDLARTEAVTVGKPLEAALAETRFAAEVLRFFGSIAGAANGRAMTLANSLMHYSLRVPVGVCGLIVPWNYPLLLATWKLAPALATGCTVVLKPDPATPITAVRLAELAKESGFPDGVVNVIPADGPTSARLVAHPGIDKISFTGSTRVGAEVMRTAAAPLKRLTLELGGKSPGLIFADADVDAAIEASLSGILYNSGQSCDARSRLLVEASIYEHVVRRLVESAAGWRIGDPFAADTQMGPLISHAHREKVDAFVRSAAAEGAEILIGGKVPPGPGAFYPPTVIASVRETMDIVQQEVFGPVVTVMPFTDESDAIRLANLSAFGLLAAVWTTDVGRAHRLARAITAGTVTVNTAQSVVAGVPFGGLKDSGFGRELGQEALDAYLETKSVLIQT